MYDISTELYLKISIKIKIYKLITNFDYLIRCHGINKNIFKYLISNSLGKYLLDKIINNSNFELEFVWNRSPIQDDKIDKSRILENLNDFTK